METINENDLDSNELISALKSIEMETISLVELQMLRNENRRLRDELLQRHQIRLSELHQMEKKRMSLIQIIDEMKKESEEMFRMKSSIINLQQSLDKGRDLLFEISFAFMSGEKVGEVFTKLQDLNRLIQDSSNQLGNLRTSEDTLIVGKSTQQLYRNPESEESHSRRNNSTQFVTRQPTTSHPVTQSITHSPGDQQPDNSSSTIGDEWNTLLEEIKSFDFECLV